MVYHVLSKDEQSKNEYVNDNTVVCGGITNNS